MLHRKLNKLFLKELCPKSYGKGRVCSVFHEESYRADVFDFYGLFVILRYVVFIA